MRWWRALLLTILILALPVLSACDVVDTAGQKATDIINTITGQKAKQEAYEQQQEYYRKLAEAANQQQQQYQQQIEALKQMADQEQQMRQDALKAYFEAQQKALEEAQKQLQEQQQQQQPIIIPSR